MKYRMTTEISFEVEADDEDEAMIIAEQTLKDQGFDVSGYYEYEER